jgi:hypothetical protein
VRAIKTTTISILAVGLLAGSAVGVAAQDEAAAPVEFTAEWAFGNAVRTDTSEVGDGVLITRGGAWRPGVITSASDPRLEGEVTLVINHDRYPSDGALQVFNSAFSVENGEGTWRGVPHPTLRFSDAEASGRTQLFIGEGGYAGSYALVDIQGRQAGEGWTLRGVIFEGEPPPAPEPFVSE